MKFNSLFGDEDDDDGSDSDGNGNRHNSRMNWKKQKHIENRTLNNSRTLTENLPSFDRKNRYSLTNYDLNSCNP